MVIEDAAYQGLRYRGQDIPPILALEQQEVGDINACRTVYCGTFSKTLTPGLRVGWVVAAKPVIDQLVLIKQAADLHSATLNQMIVAQVIKEGFADHISTLCTNYRTRRDAMVAALGRYMPDGVTWNDPDGGMFVWVALPTGLDANDLLRQALETFNVAFVPGQAFFADASGGNTLRLSFSCASAAEIDTGIQGLAQAIAQMQRRR